MRWANLKDAVTRRQYTPRAERPETETTICGEDNCGDPEHYVPSARDGDAPQ